MAVGMGYPTATLSVGVGDLFLFHKCLSIGHALDPVCGLDERIPAMGEKMVEMSINSTVSTLSSAVSGSGPVLDSAKSRASLIGKPRVDAPYSSEKVCLRGFVFLI